jgi:hypothetical protein
MRIILSQIRNNITLIYRLARYNTGKLCAIGSLWYRFVSYGRGESSDNRPMKFGNRPIAARYQDTGRAGIETPGAT